MAPTFGDTIVHVVSSKRAVFPRECLPFRPSPQSAAKLPIGDDAQHCAEYSSDGAAQPSCRNHFRPREEINCWHAACTAYSPYEGRSRTVPQIRRVWSALDVGAARPQL